MCSGIFYDYYRTFGHWADGVFNDKNDSQSAEERAGCVVEDAGSLQVLVLHDLFLMIEISREDRRVDGIETCYYYCMLCF